MRKKPGKKLNDCVVLTVKHDGGSVMVCGCFGEERAGNLIQVMRITKKE